MSVGTRDSDQVQAQFETFCRYVSFGLGRVSCECWSEWLTYDRTPDVFRRIAELEPDRVDTLLREYAPEWFDKGDYPAFLLEMEKKSGTEPLRHRPFFDYCDVGEYVGCTVTSGGMTGFEWLKQLVRQPGNDPDFWVFTALQSPKFIPTRSCAYYVNVLKRQSSECSVESVLAEARRRGWRYGSVIPFEVACLMWEHLPGRSLASRTGLSKIVFMHEPVDGTRLLAISQCGEDSCLTSAVAPFTDCDGFAFLA